MKQAMIRYYASQEEISILADIEEVGYGEIYAIENPDCAAKTLIEISPQKKNLLEALKRIGKISRLIVHDSEPASIEYRTITENGRKCLKKMRM